jgi:hypothetical protein
MGNPHLRWHSHHNNKINKIVKSPPPVNLSEYLKINGPRNRHERRVAAAIAKKGKKK